MSDSDRDEVRDQIARAMGERSRRLPAEFDDEMDHWRELADAALTVGVGDCHDFDCRNDRSDDSPYCQAHTQIAQLLVERPSWLVPWDELPEPDREVDRRIGETLARVGISAGVVAQRPHPTLAETRTGTDWCPNCREEAGTNRYSDDGGTERCATCGRKLAERARDSSREAGQP